MKPSLEVPSVWLAVTLFVGLVAGLRWVVLTFPGGRRRYIFCRRPVWLVRFVSGELPVLTTLFQGAPVTGLVFWWLCSMGFSPAMPWLYGVTGGWCGVLAVALVNAGRKSRLEGQYTLMLALLGAVLLMLAAAGIYASWRVLC
ncbi:hypothetical protein [Serratia bockelmannii]|uniref:hypothetical protein n=1 Tax=Serratia bockelmannii TaxID=2703793 RepID=UPI003FA69D90